MNYRSLFRPPPTSKRYGYGPNYPMGWEFDGGAFGAVRPAAPTGGGGRPAAPAPPSGQRVVAAATTLHTNPAAFRAIRPQAPTLPGRPAPPVVARGGFNRPVPAPPGVRPGDWAARPDRRPGWDRDGWDRRAAWDRSRAWDRPWQMDPAYLAPTIEVVDDSSGYYDDGSGDGYDDGSDDFAGAETMQQRGEAALKAGEHYASEAGHWAIKHKSLVGAGVLGAVGAAYGGAKLGSVGGVLGAAAGGTVGYFAGKMLG